MEKDQSRSDVASAARLILARHGGPAIVSDRRRFAALLADHAPLARREIRVLGEALAIGAFANLVAAPRDQLSFEQARLTSRLETDLGLQRELAAWAIELIAELATGTVTATAPPLAAAVIKKSEVQPPPPSSTASAAAAPIVAQWGQTPVTAPAAKSPPMAWLVCVLVGSIISSVNTLSWFSVFAWRAASDDALIIGHATVGVTVLVPLIVGLALRSPIAALVISLLSGGIELVLSGELAALYLRLGSGSALALSLLLLRRLDRGPLLAMVASCAAITGDFLVVWLVLDVFYYSNVMGGELALVFALRVGSALACGALLAAPGASLLRRLVTPAERTSAASPDSRPPSTQPR